LNNRWRYLNHEALGRLRRAAVRFEFALEGASQLGPNLALNPYPDAVPSGADVPKALGV
jgi:hypothetical protein